VSHRLSASLPVSLVLRATPLQTVTLPVALSERVLKNRYAMGLLKDLRALRDSSANQVAATRSVRLVKRSRIRVEEPIYGLFARRMTPVLRAVATMEYVHPNNLALSTNLEAIAQVIRTAPQDAASMANVSLAVSATIQRVLLARSAT